MDQLFGDNNSFYFDNYIPNLCDSTSIPLHQTPEDLMFNLEGEDEIGQCSDNYRNSGYLDRVVAKATAFPTKVVVASDEFSAPASTVTPATDKSDAGATHESATSVTPADSSDISPGVRASMTLMMKSTNLRPEIRRQTTEVQDNSRSAGTSTNLQMGRAQERKKKKRAEDEKRRRGKVSGGIDSLRSTVVPNSNTTQKISSLEEIGEGYEKLEKDGDMTSMCMNDDDELSTEQELGLYCCMASNLGSSLLDPSLFLHPPFSSSPPTADFISLCSTMSAAVQTQPEKMEVYTQMAKCLHQIKKNQAGLSSTTNQYS